MILDLFSRWTADHPTHQGDPRARVAGRYVVAPADGAVEPGGFRAHAGAAEGVEGGLLPVLELSPLRLLEAARDRWWRALLFAPNRAGLGLDDAETLEAVTRGALATLPVVVDCGRNAFSRPPQIEAFLRRFPKRPVVLTHGGQLNISGGHLAPAEAIFRDHDNTFLETSGIYRQDFLEQMADLIGVERVVYGSGHPHMHERVEIERVRLLPIGDEEKEAILWKNGARLLMIDWD